MASGIEFDWDDENKKRLDAHRVAPAEFEQVLNNEPMDLNFDLIDNEERCGTGVVVTRSQVADEKYDSSS